MKTAERPHRPVMVDELLEILDLEQVNTVVDATFGAGGHASAVLKHLDPKAQLIGFERDPDVFCRVRNQATNSRVTLVNKSYRELDTVLLDQGLTPDAVYFDLGLCSLHLDDSNRGFSFENGDDPFDCRFNPQEGRAKASEILNTVSQSELVQVLEQFGEVRRAKPIAGALVDRRPVETVKDVRSAVESVIPPPHLKGELARVFQAFRIHVNDEFEHLKTGLQKALDALRSGGRIAVLTYHSLEDRIVKDFFRYESKKCVCPPDLPVCACEKEKRCEVLKRSPLTPEREEVEENPRARSATLRAATKC